MAIAWTLLDLQIDSTADFQLDTTGLSAGDAVAMIVHNGQDQSASIAPDESGWTEAFSPLQGWGADVTLSCWVRHLSAPPPATYGVTWLGGISSVGSLLKITGHDPSNLIDVADTRVQTNAAGFSPAVTTTKENTSVLRLMSHQKLPLVVDDGPGTTLYFRDGGVWIPGAGASYADQAAIGDTGEAVWDSASSGSYGSATVAINSAPSATILPQMMQHHGA